MKRLLLFAVMLTTACAPHVATTSAPRPDSVHTETLAPGVTYVFRKFTQGPLQIHELIVDPRACGIHFRTIKAQDRVFGRERPEAMARRSAEALQRPVLGAINSDFFSYEPPGVSEGPQISNGVLIKSEGAYREALEDRLLRSQPVFAFTADRKRFLTFTRLRGNVHVHAIALPLGGINVPARKDSVFVFDARYGAATPTDTGAIELTLRAVGDGTGLTRTGVVVSRDTAASGIALSAQTFVIAAHGTAAQTLASAAAGDTVRIDASFEGLPGNVTEMVGGYPMLLVHGRSVHHDEPGLRAAFSDRPHPRSAIAWGSDRRIHILLAEGRRPGVSVGMSLQQLADYLRAMGLTEAMNFDGGGSSTLVVNGRMANQATDNTGERAVSNALLVLGPKPGLCKRK